MPEPDRQDSLEDQKRKESFLTRSCRRNILVALSVITIAGGGLMWRDSHADALLTRIHHGLVICASGKAATTTLPSPTVEASRTDTLLARLPVPTPDILDTNDLPTMVALEVTRNEGGKLAIAGSTSLPLHDALKLSYRRHELVMLSIHDIPASEVVKELRATGMRKRAVLMAHDLASAHDALAADRSVVVAMPVQSARDAHLAKQLAGRHPYALYLPANASSSLFESAHRDADAVIASSPDPANNVTATRKLLDEPVDIVVTEHPDRLASVIGGT
ncbi:hypothetical protein [Acetobacter sp.]|jgi:hypothetical protein|uniref:hypothetical protein n=1 Tax=Acetobacter sp. TaxID=440 RepID=UPI0025B9843B|nr:hypothetical protein [Acetobacter sp.]MCH4090274.1 hypothetical protein [Acetobacter sp.]MCI1298968.1 hypothetical protein [Acetobacter sp.]MCI1314988.1 hypothetical protein [Acetobacter sp.]